MHRVTQAGAVRLAASGRYRAVIAGLGGRLALPGAYLAARARGVPFVLWATVWAHPRTPAHALSVLPTRHLYRHADAVATYGDAREPPRGAPPRARERRRGATGGRRGALRRARGRAPSGERWRRRAGAEDGDLLVLFVGRLEREKGVDVLLRGLAPGRRWPPARGWRSPATARWRAPSPGRATASGRWVTWAPPSCPALYAAADVLVLPSVRTATFVEPWGLVVNEAMLQSTPVVASDAVGAVAGGLVRDGTTGLVFPAGDARALAARLKRAAKPRQSCARALARAAREAALALTPAAWADGMSRALEPGRGGTIGRDLLACRRAAGDLIRARSGLARTAVSPRETAAQLAVRLCSHPRSPRPPSPHPYDY